MGQNTRTRPITAPGGRVGRREYLQSMNIFDIMGPVMVGPSSSHTAGAARIGLLTRKLLGGQPRRAELLLHGSFAATGAGHGTDRALAAGLLGIKPDDARLPAPSSWQRRRGWS